MKKDYQMGKLPYASPTVELSDFAVEAGIATSFQGDDSTSTDFDVNDYWTEQ